MVAEGLAGSGGGWMPVLLYLAGAAPAFLLGGLTVAFFRSLPPRRGGQGGEEAELPNPSGEVRASAGPEQAPGDCRALASAHELKNYLCTIKGNARLLRLVARGGEQADIIDRIDRAIEKMERFAWKERSEVPDPVETRSRVVVDVAQAARACARLHFAGTGVSFPCEVGGGEPWVLGDPLRFDQVFRNLYGNALEAGASIVSARFRRIDRELEISMEDDGRGCAPDAAERIFQPFYSTKSTSGPRGLGLFIVRSIVENHGGRIRAVSKNGRPGGGRGLVVYIHLPLASQAPAPSGPPPSIRPHRGLTVLRSAA
jgi:signal transduction histidine kinase